MPPPSTLIAGVFAAVEERREPGFLLFATSEAKKLFGKMFNFVHLDDWCTSGAQTHQLYMRS